MVEDVIDAALKKLLLMKPEAFEKYKPKTVGEEVAMNIVRASTQERDITASKIIAERTGGRATQKNEAVDSSDDLTAQLKDFLRG